MPALVRHQTAEIVDVIMTIHPMPALVSHLMVAESAIIRSAVIMTIRPMPALVRHQMEAESAIIVSALIMTTRLMPALTKHQLAKDVM